MIEHEDYLLKITKSQIHNYIKSQICNFLGSGQTHLKCPTLHVTVNFGSYVFFSPHVYIMCIMPMLWVWIPY